MLCTGRARLKAVGDRARAELTENMPPMSVTLDVSKLSGWLNASAFCRVERRAYAMRGERAWGDGSACGVHGVGPTQGYGGQGTRGAHVEHLEHGRDLGRVEAERLVERRRFLPSRRAGMRCEKRCAAREA